MFSLIKIYETAYYTNHFKKKHLDLFTYFTPVFSNLFLCLLSLSFFLSLSFPSSFLSPLSEDDEPK